MNFILPTVLVTLPCLSLSANADGQSKAEQALQFMKMLESTDSQMSSEGTTRRFSLGDMGEMVFSMSMESHEDEHDHDQEDHGGVLEFDLGELTGGQVAGQILIDMSSMSDHQIDHGEFDSNIDIQMIMEDEEGRREFSRSFGNGHHNGPTNTPSWNPSQPWMPGDMIMMNAGQLPPGGMMGATGVMPGFHMPMDNGHTNELMMSMMAELVHLREDLDSIHRDDDDGYEDERHAHMEEMMHHAHEIEEHLDRHRDEIDDQEREDMMRELQHLHQEIRQMEEDGHRDEHDEHRDQGDPFFGMASDFVHKIAMAGEMADALNNREAVAVFSVWMARKHLEPEARVELLMPMTRDEDLYMSVRNAATWVVMDAMGEMHRESDAQSALSELIRSNGTK